MKKTLKAFWGKDAEYTAFGMIGCSHGMYCANRETYVYGIKGIFNIEYEKRWGYTDYSRGDWR